MLYDIHCLGNTPRRFSRRFCFKKMLKMRGKRSQVSGSRFPVHFRDVRSDHLQIY